MKLQQTCGKIVARGLLSTKPMSVYSAEYHAMVHSPATPASPASNVEQVTVAGAKPDDTAKAGGEHEGFFHHLLDVINPLQHLPIIGTIYRAITGEHIGPVEKVMGDTLYGGLWGAVSSFADVAFEGITGKSAEDTVLGWFSHGSGPRLASVKVGAPAISPATSLPSADLPALPSMLAASATPDGMELVSFSNALSAKGVNGELAQRALYAYRRSMGMPAQPVLSSLY
jgi:hypothetical protein